MTSQLSMQDTTIFDLLTSAPETRDTG